MSSPPLRSAAIELTIPFHDLDPVNIVWHGNYAKYFEQARCALLETFNYNYDAMRASGYIWPVVDLHVRYVKPLHFNQKVRVQALLKEWEYRLKIEYLISDVLTGVRLAKGSSIQVAVDAATKEMCLLSPRVLFERLGLEYPV
ncbi:MAG: acyl-CoA thioesterase [Steroidobacteraceae bacterium]